MARSLRFFRPLMPGFSKKLVLYLDLHQSFSLHVLICLMFLSPLMQAVPTGFVKHIMKEKSSTKTATLVIPNGEQWHVDIFQDKKLHDIYFYGHGWLKFVHAHNLGLGYFLVFCYRGNMIFDVRAYDLSTCEITSYESTYKNRKIPVYKPRNEKKIEYRKNKSIEKKSMTKEKSEIQQEFEDASKDAKNETIEKKKNKTSEIKIEDLEESDEFSPKKKRKILQEKIMNHKKSDKSSIKRLKTDSNYKRRMATSRYHERIERNNWSNKGEKPHFEATIWPCNISSSYMNIPRDFIDANGLTEHGLLTLKDPKGRSWPVCLVHRSAEPGSGKNRSHMSTGWREFAIANDLKLGDTCRFEFASEDNNDKAVMQVEMWKNVV